MAEVVEMDENLPTTTEDTTALEALDPGTLTFELEAIRRKPLSRMVVEEAADWDAKAKTYLEAAEKSPVREKINELFKQHRFWLGMFNRAVDPIKQGREHVAGLFKRWENMREAEAAAERRKREQAAKEEQERQRAADVAHLKTLGHVDEAKQLAKAQLPPVALPDEKKPAGKLESISFIDVWKLDPLKPVNDYKALYHYIADHPELWFHQEFSASRWKRTLTDAKGQVEIPGLNIVKDKETRHR